MKRLKKKFGAAPKGVDRVAMIGFGAVGQALYRAINLSKILPSLCVSRVVVANSSKARIVRDDDDHPVALPASMISTDINTVLTDETIRLVVDVSNADCPSSAEAVLASGRNLVSANKKLMARFGRQLFRSAKIHGASIGIEATALGKVPAFLAIAQFSRRLGISEFSTICNGTTNFMLSEMSTGCAGYDEALSKAQALDYAEANPTLDVDGYDSLYKAKLLAVAAWGMDILDDSADEHIYRDGIQGIARHTFKYARHCGRVIKLLTTAERFGGTVGIRILPALIPQNSFLGGLYGVQNGIVIRERLGPPTEFAGPGAGPDATAAALLSDIWRGVSAPGDFRNVLQQSPPGMDAALLPLEEVSIRPVFQSQSPAHELGVIAEKTALLRDHGISIEQMDNEALAGDAATYDLLFGEKAPLGRVLAAATALSKLKCVVGPVKLLEVGGNDPINLD